MNCYICKKIIKEESLFYSIGKDLFRHQKCNPGKPRNINEEKKMEEQKQVSVVEETKIETPTVEISKKEVGVVHVVQKINQRLKMKKQSKFEQLKFQFYIKDNKININAFGTYRLGLTKSEILDYLTMRYNLKYNKQLTKCPTKIWKQFNQLFGCGICILFRGLTLTYKWDVEHISDVIFDGKPFMWD